MESQISLENMKGQIIEVELSNGEIIPNILITDVKYGNNDFVSIKMKNLNFKQTNHIKRILHTVYKKLKYTIYCILHLHKRIFD